MAKIEAQPAKNNKPEPVPEIASEKPEQFTSEKSPEIAGAPPLEFTSEKPPLFTSEKGRERQEKQPFTLTVYAGEKIVGTREISPAKNRRKSGEKSGRKGRPRKNGLPDIGKYFYWKPVSDGFSLEHRPLLFSDTGAKLGQDYEYCGFLNQQDCDTLRGEKNEQEIVRDIKRIIAAKRIVTFARRRSVDRTARKSERA